ncbi:MAG: extracellular solute-binding protein, partial [Treponema sp.]|nr:extracellular solute-binding protein [Treponema sp.]
MKNGKLLVLIIVLLLTSTIVFAVGARDSSGSSAKEIRVLLANHPYGELLRPLIPEFERETGIRVIVESLQEAQLTQRLTTEFASGSSTVDVFMTRPLQETLLFLKNNWYAPLDGYDFSDYSSNTVDIGRKDGKAHVVPLVTEWQVLYYRKDLLERAGLKVPTTFAELENAARILNTGGVAGFGSRGAGAAAVTQLSSYVYNYGGKYLDNNIAVFDRPEAMEAIRFYGNLLGNYGPQGVTAMSWEHLMPVFQAGRL